MTEHFRAGDRVGDIVTRLPDAAKLFMAYNIDFCCGGSRSLSEAADEQGLNVREVLVSLEGLQKRQSVNNTGVTDWSQQSATRLTEYIVSTHHAFLKENLSRISELLFMILLVHSDRHPELYRVHELYNDLRKELEAHLVKEETILFPLIQLYEADADGGPDRDQLIEVMGNIEDEHVLAGDILKELREITDGYSPPEDGCGTFEISYRKLAELEENTFRHIHLENNVMFQKI